MRKLLFVLSACLSLAAAAGAAPWAVVAGTANMSIHVIDLGANPPRAYGPFLQGSLGAPEGGLFDVAMTPDGRYALLSNFNGQEIYKVDLANPLNPTLAGTIRVAEMNPEDIAISADGKVAIVSDGGDSTALLFIDIASFAGYSIYSLQTIGATAMAVSIGPDGTVYVCDYENDRLIYGPVNAAGTGLTREQWVATGDKPTNVTVSPDGATVLVPCAGDGRVMSFHLGAAALSPVMSLAVSGYPQSIAFVPGQAGACVGTAHYTGDKLYRISVSPAGAIASLGYVGLMTNDNGWFYGVDSVSVSPNGAFAVVGHMTSYVFGSYLNVQLVGLSDMAVSWVETNEVPVGSACFETAACAPENVQLARLSNDYIFYKETVNRLTWQAGSANYAPIVKHRIFRKLSTEPDAAYVLIAEVATPTAQYDDRNLSRGSSYVYRLTAVNDRGSESTPVEVRN